MIPHSPGLFNAPCWYASGSASHQGWGCPQHRRRQECSLTCGVPAPPPTTWRGSQTMTVQWAPSVAFPSEGRGRSPLASAGIPPRDDRPRHSLDGLPEGSCTGRFSRERPNHTSALVLRLYGRTHTRHHPGLMLPPPCRTSAPVPLPTLSGAHPASRAHGLDWN